MKNLNNKFTQMYITRTVLIVPVIIVAFYAISFAQKDKTEAKSTGAEGASQTISILPQMESGKILLEDKIDPKNYILGPGDILSIFTWGNFQGQYSIPVSPEGVLLIPEIGPISVAGLTLERAGKRISSRILKRFRNVETITSLVDLRKFKVYIGGAVISPGAYSATAVTRVSELIGKAGGFLETDRDNFNYGRGSRLIYSGKVLSSKRNIRIYRKGGDTLRADILRFEITGSTQYDPTLMDGDRIFVPVRENTINLYGIFGAVKNPGYFEYASNDSLSDLIEIAHGLTVNVDSGMVSVVRFKPDNKQTYEIVLDLRSDDWNIALYPDDRVYIKAESDYHEKHQVELRGEFKFPGFYPIRKDSTQLSDIVAMAGGFALSASLEEAELTRVSAEEVVDPEFERLRKMNVADMLESEYDYFKTKSRSKPGRVAVDFGALFEDANTEKDFILRNGDVINVPRKSKVINVIGEVANPGIQQYKVDVDYRFYLTGAGGFSDRANKGKVTIIKGITGEWKKAKKGSGLEPGDTIWIPERKKREYWSLIKDTLIFVGNLATVYLVIEQATK
ncbi:MAG: polysaccharide biosynthesis/export family protein [candidate division Zixibacteria bacterium]